MLNRISSTSFDRFLPLSLGVTVPVLLVIFVREMQRRGEGFALWIMLSLSGAASYWLVFGKTRLWIRYLVFNVVFFVLPYVATIVGPRSPTQIFSALGVCSATINFLLMIAGFRVTRRISYAAKSNPVSAIASDQPQQYTLRNIFQLMFFFALTMAVYVVWDRTLGVRKGDLTGFFSRIVAYVLLFVNLISLIVTLAPRFLLIWIIGGVALLFGLTEMFRLPGQDNGIFYLIFFYTVWMFIYAIPRARGYRWSWQAPWRSQITLPPVIHGLPMAELAPVDGVNSSFPISRENAVPPPLPPGFQQIVEPPVVVIAPPVIAAQHPSRENSISNE
jgi:hypothetical protein